MLDENNSHDYCLTERAASANVPILRMIKKVENSSAGHPPNGHRRTCTFVIMATNSPPAHGTLALSGTWPEFTWPLGSPAVPARRDGSTAL